MAKYRTFSDIPKGREPASTKDVTPLNHYDDPFRDIADKDLTPDNERLQQANVRNLIVEDLSRGMYSVGRLREKYIGNEFYKPYPWMTLEIFEKILTAATERIINDNPIDVRFEITGYLASNLGLQESLYDMMDTAEAQGQNRLRMECIRVLNQLKGERLAFMQKIGIELSKQAQDPSMPSMLPPGQLPVTDLIAQGAKILEHTTVPDKYHGVLESGDIAQDRRDREASSDVGEQQDPVDSAGIIPG